RSRSGSGLDGPARAPPLSAVGATADPAAQNSSSIPPRSRSLELPRSMPIDAWSSPPRPSRRPAEAPYAETSCCDQSYRMEPSRLPAPNRTDATALPSLRRAFAPPAQSKASCSRSKPKMRPAVRPDFVHNHCDSEAVASTAPVAGAAKSISSYARRAAGTPAIVPPAARPCWVASGIGLKSGPPPSVRSPNGGPPAEIGFESARRRARRGGLARRRAARAIGRTETRLALHLGGVSEARELDRARLQSERRPAERHRRQLREQRREPLESPPSVGAKEPPVGRI